MHMTNFYQQNRQKNVLKEVNFTNLKTPDDYIAKSKPIKTSGELFATDSNPRG